MAAASSAALAASASAPAVALNDVTIAFRLADGSFYTAVQNAATDLVIAEIEAMIGKLAPRRTTAAN